MANTYFISDMHLGAGAYPNPREVEDRVVAFLHSIRGKASALYMLGDVLDYWYEYRNCVPQGFVRFFGALAELADSGVAVYWYVGNHDVWLYDYLSREIGLTVVDPPGGGDFRTIGGKKFFLAHGDGVGRQGLFMRVARPVFRSRLARALYGAVHPRWTIGFARWWSRKSRAHGSRPDNAAAIRRRSDLRLDELIRTLADRNPDLSCIVLGHYHQPRVVDGPGACRLYILGAWNDPEPVYGVFDGSEMRLEAFKMP